MSTVRNLRTQPSTPPDVDRRDAALAVLGEMVGQLAERVELLEIRERIGDVRFTGARQARQKRVNKPEGRGEMAERLKATVC